MLERNFTRDTLKKYLKEDDLRKLNMKTPGERKDYSEGGNENNLRDNRKGILLQSVPKKGIKKNEYTG